MEVVITFARRLFSGFLVRPGDVMGNMKGPQGVHIGASSEVNQVAARNTKALEGSPYANITRSRFARLGNH
jgi:hypothetical protein